MKLTAISSGIIQKTDQAVTGLYESGRVQT